MSAAKKKEPPFDKQTLDYYEHRAYRMKYMKDTTESLKQERYKEIGESTPFDFQAMVLHQHVYLLHHLIDAFEEIHSLMELVNALYTFAINSNQKSERDNRLKAEVYKSRYIAEDLRKEFEKYKPEIEKSAKVADVLYDEWKDYTDRLDRKAGVKKDE